MITGTEFDVLFGLVAASEWEGFLTALPIVVSAIVAGIGAYLSIQLRRDKKRQEEVIQEAEENKDKLDTLTIGQAWVVDALERSEKENERLRKQVKDLEKELRELRQECNELRQRIGER